jgi:predicted dehydrogenase
MKHKRTAILVGAGHRALLYGSYAKMHPDELEIVGVADPLDLRRELAAREFGFGPQMGFESAEALARHPRLADFIINGTMDHQHVPTSVPLLERGYDLLLEKPFATNEQEMWKLVETAQKYQRKVAICHVLRYAPFYAAIRQRVRDGEIGAILSVQLTEHVSYHHVAVGYVRGKWNKKSYCQTGMLLAKSCHDLDLMAWMKSGVRPTSVASCGSNFQFRPENSPPGAGTRCLVDCSIEAECLYSARKHYLDHPERWAFYVWDSLENLENPTFAEKEESLKTSSYGRCVWKTDMDVVDHQSVLVEFEDGCTGTLNMIGGTAKPSRSIHLVGTRGEIEGRLEDNCFVIRHIDPRPGCEYSEEKIDLHFQGDTTGSHGGHAGGDMCLVADFIRVLNGEEPSISSTSLLDSISGHLIGFAAERSRETRQVEAVRVDRLPHV